MNIGRVRHSARNRAERPALVQGQVPGRPILQNCSAKLAAEIWEPRRGQALNSEIRQGQSSGLLQSGPRPGKLRLRFDGAIYHIINRGPEIGSGPEFCNLAFSRRARKGWWPTELPRLMT